MLETAKKLGLFPEEYDYIVQILGREPNFTELSVFSVMWSEHCSYKNSIAYLKKLPKKGPQILVEAGEENAGLVDIGDRLACAFKIESHNHPSAIEPYQGAATGVGGIHRDIFTLGARPVAALNSLRFGDINLPRTRTLLKGVVKGIADYGNAFGVPTVAGEIYFDPSYNINPLVNAMSIGLVEHGKTISATATGVGNPVFIVGSATGKDGIHGATFASGDLDADSAKKLPSVQVGDPFQEKLLLEATLEAVQTGAIVGMQDMGAAGITCCTSEMAAKGNVGMNIWLDEVPLRQQDMKPYEILLSESQERMLIVVEKGREQEVLEIYEKWDLNCVQIAEITEGPELNYYMGGQLVATVPAESLVLGGGAPVYHRESKEPQYFQEIARYEIAQVGEPQDLGAVIEILAKHPNLISRRWVTEQYDSMVQTNTISAYTPTEAAITRIKETNRGIASTVDCNPYYVFADPYVGTMIAVAEAARNISCTGAKPLAVTNNLNFGNPYNPEVYYQFSNSVLGMREACLAFETPVTGGNVSFYNQSADGGAVLPTPTIGMIGLHGNIAQVVPNRLPGKSYRILMLGASRNDISSSQYLVHYHNIRFSPAPWFDLQHELALQNLVRELGQQGTIAAAHDVAEGGLFFALLEFAGAAGYAYDIAVPQNGIRNDAYLFGEAQGRILIAVEEDKVEQVKGLAQKAGIPVEEPARVAGGDAIAFGGQLLASLSQLVYTYENQLSEYMAQ